VLRKKLSLDPQSSCILAPNTCNRYDRMMTQRRTPISCMRRTVNLRVAAVDASIANNSRGNFDKRSITGPNFLLMIATFH